MENTNNNHGHWNAAEAAARLGKSKRHAGVGHRGPSHAEERGPGPGGGAEEHQELRHKQNSGRMSRTEQEREDKTEQRREEEDSSHPRLQHFKYICLWN